MSFVKSMALLPAICVILATSLLHAVESYEITIERGITATMRDGAILRADIYRPKTASFPSFFSERLTTKPMAQLSRSRPPPAGMW